MRIIRSTAFAILFAALLLPASAEVVYTSVTVSIPSNGEYSLDLDHDGLADFTLRTHFLQDYCQAGEGYSWNLSITPASGNGVISDNGIDAAALLQGSPIDLSQPFLGNRARLNELDWGHCGSGRYGQWRNLPNRYLGLQFRVHGGPTVYYGWAEVVEAAYVDRNGHLQTFVVLQGFAYETVPGQIIRAGQTTD